MPFVQEKKQLVIQVQFMACDLLVEGHVLDLRFGEDGFQGTESADI